MINIRQYKVNDFDKVIKLWNKCLSRDLISKASFQKKILADSNFDSEGCFVAEDGDNIVGFMLGIIRKVPLENIGLQPENGWITVFFVDSNYRRQQIGQKLLNQVMNYFKENERHKIYVSSYVPNYFFPGVDIDKYQGAYSFLKENGFKEYMRVIGMGNELQDMKMPKSTKEKIEKLKNKGIYIIDFEKKYTYSLLKFLREEFPGDWAPTIVDKIKRDTEDEIVLAIKNNEVLGYCQFEGSHFGPFGVSKKLRGEGIGSILFWRVVDKMKEAGEKYIWLAWTGGDAARFYQEKGNLHQSRGHVIMIKEI